MKIGCKQCGTYEKHEPCVECGQTQHMGCDYRCPHEPAFKHRGFEPYVDIQLTDHPVTITSLADRNKYMRPHWKDDHVISFRDRD